jgi:hypothetical protein
MEYDIGVRLDSILESQDKILKALAWIVQAMDDKGIKPNEEVKPDETVKA